MTVFKLFLHVTHPWTLGHQTNRIGLGRTNFSPDRSGPLRLIIDQVKLEKLILDFLIYLRRIVAYFASKERCVCECSATHYLELSRPGPPSLVLPSAHGPPPEAFSWPVDRADENMP